MRRATCTALEAAACSLRANVHAGAAQPPPGPDMRVAQALEEDVARLSHANASLAEDLQRARRRGACNTCLCASFVRVTYGMRHYLKGYCILCSCVLKFSRCLHGAGARTGCAARGPPPGGASPATRLPVSPGGRHSMLGRSLTAQPPRQSREHPLPPQEQQLRP